MQESKQIIFLSVPYCEPVPAVAPVLLTACLESAGISAKAIDFNLDFLLHFVDKEYFTDFKNFLTIAHSTNARLTPTAYKEILGWTKNYLINLRKKYNPEYIGISIFTSESLDFGLILSYLIRRYLPNVTLIAGGKGLEVATQGVKNYDIWIRHRVVDAIVIGDAEIAIIDTIKKSKRGLVFAAPQTKDDLDQIPLAKWEDYDLTSYNTLSNILHPNISSFDLPPREEPYLAITSSKGCVRKCTFCDVASFWPEFIYRDPEKVAQEIIFNYKKTGIKKFEFTDNLINGSITNFRRMNEILTKEIPGTIHFGGYAIFRGRTQMPESDFDIASRAGNAWWYIGVESGSEKLRFEMKKKFDNEDLDWSIRMLYKYNIKQTWLLMVGYPSETEKDFDETVNLIQRYQHLSDKINISVTPTFMLLNNSPLLNDLSLQEKYGLTHLDTKNAASEKFWTSTKFIDNDYPTRSRRWKTLIEVTKQCGYNFSQKMPLKKNIDEIETLDRIYNEQTRKVIFMRPG